MPALAQPDVDPPQQLGLGGAERRVGPGRPAGRARRGRRPAPSRTAATAAPAGCPAAARSRRAGARAERGDASGPAAPAGRAPARTPRSMGGTGRGRGSPAMYSCQVCVCRLRSRVCHIAGRTRLRSRAVTMTCTSSPDRLRTTRLISFGWARLIVSCEITAAVAVEPALPRRARTSHSPDVLAPLAGDLVATQEREHGPRLDVHVSAREQHALAGEARSVLRQQALDVGGARLVRADVDVARARSRERRLLLEPSCDRGPAATEPPDQPDRGGSVHRGGPRAPVRVGPKPCASRICAALRTSPATASRPTSTMLVGRDRVGIDAPAPPGCRGSSSSRSPTTS